MTNITEVIEKKESVFEKLKKYITKNRNIIVPILIMSFFVVAQNEMVFASSVIETAKGLTTKIFNSIVTVIFIGVGVLLLIFGVVEFILSFPGNNPDAKNKAIIGLGAGIGLIVLGVIFLGETSTIVNLLFT